MSAQTATEDRADTADGRGLLCASTHDSHVRTIGRERIRAPRPTPSHSTFALLRARRVALAITHGGTACSRQRGQPPPLVLEASDRTRSVITGLAQRRVDRAALASCGRAVTALRVLRPVLCAASGVLSLWEACRSPVGVPTADVARRSHQSRGRGGAAEAGNKSERLVLMARRVRWGQEGR